MKKIISFLLTLALIISTFSAVYAASIPDAMDDTDSDTGDAEIEDKSLIPESEEPYYKYIHIYSTFQNHQKTLWNQGQASGGQISEEDIRNRINSVLPELKVERILNNTYAFIANDTHWWNLNKKGERLKNVVLMDENTKFFIPGDIAKELFDVGNGNDYVSLDSIASATDWEVFTDKRGIAIVGKELAKNIQTTVNADGYYDDFYAIASAIGYITWDDVDPTPEDYKLYKEKWLNAITYPVGKEDEYRKYIDDTIAAAKEYMGHVVKDNPVSSPFDDIYVPDTSQSGTDPYTGEVFVSHSNQIGIENIVSRIADMAKAYRVAKMSGDNGEWLNELCDDIEYLCKFTWEKHLTNNAYKIEGTPRFTSFRITIPAKMTSAFLCMGDDIDKDVVEKFLHELMGRQIVPTTANYTNLMWEATASLQCGVILEDKQIINHCMRNLAQCFTNVYTNQLYPMPQDGFHEDGSFPYHGGLAYNWGYGQSFVISLSELASWSEGTFLDTRKIYGFNNVYDWIENSWLPFIYNNKKMKMVVGREAPYAEARHSMAAIILLSLLAPEDKLPSLASKVNSAITGYEDQFFTPKYFAVFRYASYPFIQEQIKTILDYIKKTDAEEFEPYNKVYYNMDRIVHRTNDYMFAIAMSSSRIGKYESSSSTPISSLTEWYISDGMTYIHNDNVQFQPTWWAHVNPYYMPGTTVDSTIRKNMQTMSMSDAEWGRPENSWAGGVSDGKIGSASMVFGNQFVSGLDGKSSWFMFEDKIVCVGSGIKNGYGNVYTTADNKKLVKKLNDEDEKMGYEQIVVNGEELEKGKYQVRDIENPKYVWIEGNTGYVFEKENKVKLDISDTVFDFIQYYHTDDSLNGKVMSSYPYIENVRTTRDDTAHPYMKLTVEHGENPENACYDYTILPTATLEQTKAYSENPTVEVIRRDEDIHEVKTTDGSIVMANLFKAGKVEEIDFLTPCAVIMKKEGDKIKFYVSDPSQGRDTISIKFPYPIEASGDNIRVDGDTVNIDVYSLRGATFSFECKASGSDATSESENTNSAIKTYEYNLMTSGYPISTILKADSISGDKVVFEIAKYPQKGIVDMCGDILLYSPKSEGEYDDSIEIRAYDSYGNKKNFTISIKGVRSK